MQGVSEAVDGVHLGLDNRSGDEAVEALLAAGADVGVLEVVGGRHELVGSTHQLAHLTEKAKGSEGVLIDHLDGTIGLLKDSDALVELSVQLTLVGEADLFVDRSTVDGGAKASDSDGADGAEGEGAGACVVPGSAGSECSSSVIICSTTRSCGPSPDMIV